MTASSDYCTRCDGYSAEVGKPNDDGLCRGCVAEVEIERLRGHLNADIEAMAAQEAEAELLRSDIEGWKRTALQQADETIPDLREDLDRLREAALRSVMYAGGGSRLAAEIALDREIKALRAADEWARSR